MPASASRKRLLDSLRESSFAIIVGINKYKRDAAEGGFDELNCAVNDARSVLGVLGETCGFDIGDESRVRILENQEATKNGITLAFKGLKEGIETLRRRKRDAAVRFVFFFAGHGVRREQGRMACALHEDQNQVEGEQGLSGKALVELTDTLEPTAAVYLLDCCGAGSTPWVSSPRRTTAWFCATDDRAAWELPDQELSPFSRALVEGLRGSAEHHPDGVFAADLKRYLLDKMPRLAADAPATQKPFVQLGGDAIRIAVGQGAEWADVSDEAASYPFDWRGDVWPEAGMQAFSCLLVSQNSAAEVEVQRGLKRLVAGSVKALARRAADIDGRELVPEPVILNVKDTVRDPKWWRQTVELLWRADVALFDLTAMEPAMLLLLGIRAVVRRGVSIMLIRKMPQAHEMKELPFAIKELNLVPFVKAKHQDPSDPAHPARALPRLMEAGYRLLVSDSHYVDLPAFDLVRQRSTVETELLGEGSPGAARRRRALFLCSFDKQYGEKAFGFFREALWAEEFNLNPFRTLEMRSPRLVSHSLAEAIRDTPFCVVDWTGFRPNVFFEMGMRLASSRVAPVCLIEEATDDYLADGLPEREGEALPPSLTPERAAELRPAVGQLRWLRRMFDPITYSEATENVSAMLDGIIARQELLEAACDGNAHGDPTLAAGGYATYSQLREKLKSEHRRPDEPLDELLEREINKLLGDTEKNLKAFALYPDDDEEQHRDREAIRILKDALWYMKGRYGDALLVEGPLRGRYVSLGQRLAAQMRKVGDERAVALRKEMNELGKGTLMKVPTP